MGPPKHPDWLPKGWKVDLKVRSFGRKDKYYTNLSNGLILNSRPEVLRYLESSEECWKPKRPNKIRIEKVVAEDLPPGWIKEIWTKRTRGKMRSDTYYIGPDSRHHFRSMQEVLRYLKSKDAIEATSKNEEECHVNHSQSSSAEAKGQMSIDKKGDKNLTRRESVTSGSKEATDVHVNMLEDNSLEQRGDDSDKPNVVNVVKQHGDGTKRISKLGDEKVDEGANVDQTPKSGTNGSAPENTEKPVMEKRERVDKSVVANLPKKPTRVNGKKQRNGGTRQRQSTRLANSKVKDTRLADSKVKDNVNKDLSLQQDAGSEAVAEKIINLPENNGLKEKENTCMIEGPQQPNLARENKRKNSNSKCASDVSRRTSKRLACLGVDPLKEAKTSNESEASTRLPEEPEIDTCTNLERINEPNEHSSTCRRENPTNDEQKKAIINETPSSLKEHKGVDVERNKDQKEEQHLDASLKDLLMDPCIEFAIKTLTGAIPIEAVMIKAGNQSSTSSSMKPSSDPGFEAKNNNGSQFQISLKKPLSSNPSFISFSQFNGIKNPWLRQQGGGSQKPVDTSGFEGQKGKLM